MQQVAQQPHTSTGSTMIAPLMPSAPAPAPMPTTPPPTAIPAETRRREVHRVAGEIYGQNPDWVTFFREVLGVEGIARRMFPSTDEFLSFEQTNEYLEIQQMVAKLRESNRAQAQGSEPTRVITVRLPKSLHESLRTEAHERRTSMNKLCISKLLQVIDGTLIPHE